MSTITPITIPKLVSSQDDLDFQFLKKIGIEYIQSLGGKLWTDYNTHDPGITMLEMLCYAISDLGNRIELPIENLLAQEDGTGLDNQFFSATDILPNRSVTALDYRKLFIDIDGVRNCWLSKHVKTVYVNCKKDQLSYDPDEFASVSKQFKRQFDFKGLYDLLVDFDISDSIKRDSPEYAEQVAIISQAIRDKYHANRNLCEDLITINRVEEQPVSVCANIEIERDADENRVNAEIIFRIRQYFAPMVNFYSLKEMTDKSYRTDEIFDGPLLDHGFIDTKELRASTLRSSVRLSDIMNIISSIEGVKLIKDITIGNCDGNETDDWVICIAENKRPKLCDKSVFNLSIDVLPVVVSEKKVDDYLATMEAEQRESRQIPESDKTIQLPETQYLDTDWYTTIQNDFPDTYGIGKYGLPSTASIERKSQAKQLKAYLLFFDQILATYFSQLGVVRDLLSINSDLKRTYFTQAVQDIKDFDELVDPLNYSVNDSELLSKQLLDSLDNISERRNELLDHLIARFAERFSEYSFLMKELYGSASTELIVKSKQDFLKDYHLVSSNRGGGFNYYRQLPAQLWDTDNVSGAERRIARLAGFKLKDFWRRNVSSSYIEIFETTLPGPITVYGWRIKNESATVILDSTVQYPNYSAASKGLYAAVIDIIQTSEKEIEQRFEANEFADGLIIGGVKVRKPTASSFTFEVIDPESTPANAVVASHPVNYATDVLFKTALLEIVDFMKFRFSEEGIFIVEHILLRPNVYLTTVPDKEFLPVHLQDCVDCDCVDPYSYRVSVVLPGYTQRFSNIDFRDFLEELIREELPSHVVPKICWVGERKGSVPNSKNDLFGFEKAYEKFLLARTNLEQAHDPDTLKPLIKALDDLNTIYPTGRLHDCETNELDGKIILGRTNLGTL